MQLYKYNFTYINTNENIQYIEFIIAGSIAAAKVLSANKIFQKLQIHYPNHVFKLKYLKIDPNKQEI